MKRILTLCLWAGRLWAGWAMALLPGTSVQAAGIVCRTIPPATLESTPSSTPPQGITPPVPADLDPHRDDWARDAWARPTTPLVIKRTLPSADSAVVAELPVTGLAIDPATGGISHNNQPINSNPAALPQQMIVCTPPPANP